MLQLLTKYCPVTGDRNATSADSRDATAVDCRYCRVTDNKNAAVVSSRNDTDTDPRDNRVTDSKRATAAGLSRAVTNGYNRCKKFFLRTLYLSCYSLPIFPSHKRAKCRTLCYRFLFLYILSLFLRFSRRLLLTLSKFLVSADVYCSNVQVVCVAEMKLRPFQ
jgi:hypothetical protein